MSQSDRKIGAELLINVAFLFCASYGLIKREINFVGLIRMSSVDLGYRRAERLEIASH
ncbi:MAG: hypothetical protein ACU4EQ_13410 [Candidatus Nitrosoglobus sp.]